MSHADRDEYTIHQRGAAVVGDELFDRALVAEEENTLADSALCWVEYDAIAALPDLPLDSWEQLIVFTENYVCRWKANGFHHFWERTPRHPNVVGRDQ